VNTNIHFWSYFVQFFLVWEMFQTKVVQKIKTHILCSNNFCFKSCRLWDNVDKYCRTGMAIMTIWRKSNARCIPKATYATSECVILINFPLQQWLHEGHLMLRYTYISCLVIYCIIYFIYLLLRSIYLNKYFRRCSSNCYTKMWRYVEWIQLA